MSIIKSLVTHFIETDELGHYNDDSICLYDIKNDSKTITRIKSDIEKYTKKYRLLVLDKEEYTNINILDINL